MDQQETNFVCRLPVDVQSCFWPNMVSRDCLMLRMSCHAFKRRLTGYDAWVGVLMVQFKHCKILHATPGEKPHRRNNDLYIPKPQWIIHESTLRRKPFVIANYFQTQTDSGGGRLCIAAFVTDLYRRGLENIVALRHEVLHHRRLLQCIDTMVWCRLTMLTMHNNPTIHRRLVALVRSLPIHLRNAILKLNHFQFSHNNIIIGDGAWDAVRTAKRICRRFRFVLQNLERLLQVLR